MFKKPLFFSLCFFILIFDTFAEIDINDPWREAQEKSYFAINGSKVFHIPNEMDTTVDKRIEWMNELGVSWDRSDLWWGTIEPEKGHFDFSIPDRIIEHFEKRHIQIYPILNYGAAWWKDRNAPQNDEEIEDFAKYVFATVDRYKDNFTYWSVWNEPNIATFWSPEPNVENYAKLLKRAYEEAKKADPNCKIAAPIIAPLGKWDKKYVIKLYELGAKDYFDIFDYHYYRNYDPEREVPEELADIRAVMKKFDAEKPIWISESGVTGTMDDLPESYTKQAALVVRNQLICLACGVKRFFYFDLQNWHDVPGSWDSKLGLIEAGDKKKPAFFAYRTMVKEVDFKKVIGRWRRSIQKVEAVLIFDEKHNEYMLAAWMPGAKEKKDFSFTCEAADIKIVHPYGKVEIIPLPAPPLPDQKTRKISVGLDRSPRYIHNVDPFTYLPEAGIRFSHKKLYLNPGEKEDLRIIKDPLLKDYKIKINDIRTPEGIIWDHKNGTIIISKNMPEGLQEITAEIEVKLDNKYFPRKTRFFKKAKIEILPALSLEIRPYTEKNKLKIQATIVNHSTWKIKGDLLLKTGVEKDKILGRIDNIELKTRERQILEIPLDSKSAADITKEKIWRLEFNKFKSRDFRIHQALFSNKKPLIDAKLDEWTGISSIKLNKKSQVTRGSEKWTEKDVSGKIQYWFSGDKIYIAANITDDDPLTNDNPANMIWKGDSIELYIGLGGPGKRTVIDKKIDFQIGIAPTYKKGKPVVFYFHKDIIIEDAEVAAVKTVHGYILEAAIPIKALGDFKLSEGMILSFDAAINDLDTKDWASEGNVPGCAIMWNGTERNWIDPSNWGLLRLRSGTEYDE
jgi:cellulose/xylan binding protein with CBM9 domain/glycosyl hydrolase family 53